MTDSFGKKKAARFLLGKGALFGRLFTLDK
jgi:hypothetical protein